MMWRPVIPIAVILVLSAGALALCIVQTVRVRANRWPWLGRSFMVLAVTGMALAPSTPIDRPQTVLSGVDVFFVVDRTGSMAAEDWNEGQPRLDGVRHDIVDLVENMPGVRYSIIAFDSNANRQLPLTSDARAVRNWADTVRQEITEYSQGSLIDRPLDPLTRALAQAEEARPDNIRLVFFFSDGENTAQGESESFEALTPFIDGGGVLGYGTEEGGRMREHTGGPRPGPEAPFIIDPNTGSPGISHIDEAQLQALADQMGVEYHHRTVPDSTAEIIGELDPEMIMVESGRVVVSYRTHVWPFAAVFAVLLAFEALWLGGQLGGRRKS